MGLLFPGRQFSAALTLLGLTCAQVSAAPCFSNETFPEFANANLLQKMARGINVPNWDADDPEARPNPLTLRLLIDLGFTHVRLPVYHGSFAGTEVDPAGVADFGTSLLSTIESLTGMGYTVSVDLHPDGAFNTLYKSEPETGYVNLVASWQFLSSILRTTSPDDVAIEFLNEPDTDPQTWATHSADLAGQLRNWLPEHTFIVGPAGPMRHENFADLLPLDDPNTIYAFHYYDPFIFTHQGAEWHSPEDPVRLTTGVPFPTVENDPRIAALVVDLKAAGKLEAANEVSRIFDQPWTERNVENAMDTIQDWSERFRRPVMVNEFGVLSYHAPRTDRLHWLETVVSAAEKRCIGWTHWDFSDGFGIVDPETDLPDAEALAVLLPPPPHER